MTETSIQATHRVELADVGQIAITARDLPRAVRFYRDTLELPLLLEIPGAAFLQCGGVRLMLATPEPEVDHPASIVYYRVGDIHATHRALEARGVRFRGAPHLVARMPDHELWMAFFDDTEGNLLALMGEVRGGRGAQAGGGAG